MYLKIENPDNLDLDDFVKFLIEKIKDIAINSENYDKELAKLWGEYFKSNDIGWPKDQLNHSIPPSFDFVVNEYFSNLEYIKSKDCYIIGVDKNKKLGLSHLPIDNIATIINYGTLTLKAYPYFDMVFNIFADELPQIYKSWSLTYGSRTL